MSNADDITASRKNGGRQTKRPKGYATWSPQKKTRIVLTQVDQILREYRDHLPLTARQVFYRLVGSYGYPKDEKAYERLTNYLSRARRAKLIPFEYLRDDGATVMDHPNHFESEEAFYTLSRRQAERFKLHKLADQAVSIRVYCEAAGMMPQLHRTLEEFSVPVYSCSGFDSLTAKWQLKEWCHDTLYYGGQTPVILHLGDHDPSGESIFESMRDDVYAFLEEDAPSDFLSMAERFPFERVALSGWQVQVHDLPTAPPKRSDSRTRRWSGETCQLEALPPDELALLLRLAVRGWLDCNALEKRIEVEPAARRNILRALPAPDDRQT